MHYSYESRSQGWGCTQCFTLAAHGDVDGDGAISSVLYVHPQFDTSGNPQQCPTYLGGALTVPLQPGSGNPMFDQVAVNPLNDDY